MCTTTATWHETDEWKKFLQIYDDVATAITKAITHGRSTASAAGLGDGHAADDDRSLGFAVAAVCLRLCVPPADRNPRRRLGRGRSHPVVAGCCLRAATLPPR